jgi:molybdopterin synthase catalytic subunit
MAKVSVQAEDFNVAAEIARMTAGRTDIGGLGCFIGVVRADKPPASPSPEADGRAVRALTLEHYPAMTLRAVGRVTAEAEQRWSLLDCTVIHRIGRMVPGDNIVLVLTAAAHRQAALDSTAFLIDWLKTKAPFWKREEFLDGAAAWVDARESDDTAAARW